MEWLVRLSGDHADLGRLCADLASGTTRVIRRESENPGYYLSSETSSQFTDADEVRRASEELIAIINGVAKLQWPDAQPVGFDGIVRAGDEREDVFIFVASCHLRLADGVPTVSVGPVGAQKPTPHTSTLEPLIASAGRDAAIAKALRILGSFEPNWAVLRKLYEVVEGDVGQPSRIEKLGWATQEEIKRFKESASDPAASGDDAVHGFSRSPLRHAPLPLGEGWVLVRTILRRWIHSKL